MLFTQGAPVPQSKEISLLPAIQPVPRVFSARKYPSSVLSMPVEVTTNIFDLTFHSSHDPISQSISLSHVCRKWRQISLSAPSLWTFIYLSFPLSQHQLTRTCTWIIRSRNRPLDIYMDFRDPSWNWDESSHVFDCKAMEGIMRFLVPHASRWRSIELFTDNWAPIFTFLSCTAAIESTPFLETIRLARCNEYFVVEGETFRPMDLALPIAWFRGGASLTHLRHVSLSGVHVDWAQCGLRDLRELELRYHAQDVMPTLSHFRGILRDNPALERLVVLGWGPRMGRISENKHGSDDLQAISLPQLEVLEFGFVDVGYAVGLLSLLDLPKLRALTIEDVAFGLHIGERQDCSRLLDRLVEMSATRNDTPHIPLARLREVSLRSVHAGDASIRGLFGRLRAVTSLSLDRIDVAPLLAICAALHVCELLEVLTLKAIDSAAAATALTSLSRSFPARLRVFLDTEGDEDSDEDLEEEEEEEKGV